MGRILYGHYSDNVAPLATWAVNTGAEDPDYLAANLVDRNPAKPAQLTGTTGSWVGSYAGAQRVDLVVLPMHNLIAGLEVRIQGNAANAWGAPTFNQAITIPAYRADLLPTGCFLDLTGLAGYNPAGFQFWRLVVVGVNSQPVKVGELLLLSTKRTMNPNVNWPVKPTQDRPIIENRTDYRVSTVYDLGTTIRRFQGDVDTTDVGWTALEAWWLDCRGRARAFTFIPDESVNVAWMGRFASTMLDPTQAITDRNTWTLDVEEVSRGLYL